MRQTGAQAVRSAQGPNRAVTRADVARLAGVSSAVVSYVVNDGPRPVAAATADRVREAMELLGYRPNASARALRTVSGVRPRSGGGWARRAAVA